jgi:hypothetical protein
MSACDDKNRLKIFVLNFAPAEKKIVHIAARGKWKNPLGTVRQRPQGAI